VTALEVKRVVTAEGGGYRPPPPVSLVERLQGPMAHITGPAWAICWLRHADELELTPDAQAELARLIMLARNGKEA
jgi:hypothetical protein